MKMLHALSFTSLLALTGCSSLIGGNSEFGCSGMPNSVTCMGVTDVHKLTDGDDYQEKIDEVSRQQLAGEDSDKKSLKQAFSQQNVNVNRTESGQYTPVPKPASDPQPIRSESMVMRVLIDPYEDSDGDLVIAGYIYTEISPRAWDVGEPRRTNKHNIKLIQLQSPEATTPKNEK